MKIATSTDYFELAEADVCQYIGRLQPVMRPVNAWYSRCRRAGRINAGWNQLIKQLDVEVIKLHQGLSRNIEKRSENQLLVQSLVEACKGMPVQVLQPAFAVAVNGRCCLSAVSRVVRGILPPHSHLTQM